METQATLWADVEAARTAFERYWSDSDRKRLNLAVAAYAEYTKLTPEAVYDMARS